MKPTRVRASAVCVDGDALLCVRLRDPATQVARLFAPGGAIEPGEMPAATAARETREETGYEVEVDAASELVARYPYPWNGVERDVVTHFFRATLLGTRADQHPDFVRDGVHLAVVWLPLRELDAQLGFDAHILNAVRALLGPARAHEPP